MPKNNLQPQKHLENFTDMQLAHLAIHFDKIIAIASVTRCRALDCILDDGLHEHLRTALMLFNQLLDELHIMYAELDQTTPDVDNSSDKEND